MPEFFHSFFVKMTQRISAHALFDVPLTKTVPSNTCWSAVVLFVDCLFKKFLLWRRFWQDFIGESLLARFKCQQKNVRYHG